MGGPPLLALVGVALVLLEFAQRTIEVLISVTVLFAAAVVVGCIGAVRTVRLRRRLQHIHV